MGVAPATVMERARDALLRTQALPASATRCSSPIATRSASTDPSRPWPGRRSMFVGARSYVLERAARLRKDRTRRSPATRGSTTTTPLRVGLRAVARRLRADGYKAVAFADDNSIVDREVAYLAGIGWFGKNANLLLPGRRQLVRARLRRHHRAAAGGDRAGRRRLRHAAGGASTAARPAAIVAPGVVDAGRCLAWLLQKPGIVPASSPRVALGDRLYGCDDCQEVCPPTVRLAHRRRRPTPATRCRRGSLLDLLDAADDELLERLGALVPGRPRPALAAAQRPRRARQRRRRRRRPHVSRVLARYLADADPMLRAHAVWAAAPARARPDRCRAGDPDPDVAAELALRARPMKHLLVTNDFPPKIGGIQSLLWEWWRRLPAESFAVLTSPYAGAAAFDAEQPFRIERVPRAGAAAAPVDGAAASTSWPREVGADLVVLDPAVPLGLVGPSLRPALRRRAARRRGHRARPAAGHRAGARPRAARRPPRHRRRRLPGRRGRARRRTRRCRSPSCRPASTSTASSRSTTSERTRPPASDFGLPADAELVRRHQPARAAQGLRHGDPRRGPAAPLAPDLRAGDLRRRPRRAPAASAGRASCDAPVRFLGRVSQRRPAAPVRLRRRVHDAVPQPLGRARAGGVRHRLRRGRGVRRAPGGRRLRRARPRRSPTARPASSCARPTTTARSPRRSPACSTTRRGGATMGGRPARAVAEFSYDVLAERLGRSLGALA